jgi:hypothetical protein
MDETGFSDFVDALIEKFIGPDAYLSEWIPIPADRTVKRATLVGGIATDCIPLKPLIILPRKTTKATLFL